MKWKVLIAITAIFISGNMMAQTCVVPSPNTVAWLKAGGDTIDVISEEAFSTSGVFTYAPGVVGQAFDFDGVNDAVSKSYPANPVGIDNWGFEAWFYWRGLTNAPTIHQIMFYLHTAGPTITPFLAVSQHGGTQGKLELYTGGELAFLPVGLDLNSWNHIALTRDNGVFKLYKNGVKVYEKHHSQAYISEPVNVLVSAGYNFAFNGMVDEFSLINSAITADYVQAIVNAGSRGKCAPPDDMIEDLVQVTLEIDLANGVESALDAKLDSAFDALDDVNENNDVAACNSLEAFIYSVESQSGKRIEEEDANYLIELAENILIELGCI